MTCSAVNVEIRDMLIVVDPVLKETRLMRDKIRYGEMLLPSNASPMTQCRTALFAL